MKLELTVDESSLERCAFDVFTRVAQVRPEVEAAMAGRYKEIVLGNFGDVGIDRPLTWPLLSPSYAKQVGRPHATLFVTGTLFGAVKLETDESKAEVSVSNADVPYAVVHQTGSTKRNLPARPYFPIEDDGRPTTYSAAQVTAAAASELRRLLS